MAETTGVEWTDSTWPVVQGCDYESPGCAACYAVPLIWRLSHNPDPKISAPLDGLVEKHNGKLVWTGKLALREDRLDWPMKWAKPRRIFVPSHGDLFHEGVPDAFIDRVFAVMALCPQHSFQVLTKRADRMLDYVTGEGVYRSQGSGLEARLDRIDAEMNDLAPAHWCVRELQDVGGWPLSNVWLGVSVEDQRRADLRIPALLQTPAAFRFLSCEPLLGAVDLERVAHENDRPEHYYAALSGYVIDGSQSEMPRVDWVIVGGESEQPGHQARPMHPDWARTLRDQCASANVPLFFKQWGAWAPTNAVPGGDLGGDMRRGMVEIVKAAGPNDGHFRPGDALMRRLGKKAAGRRLDGVEHSAFPAARAPA